LKIIIKNKIEISMGIKFLRAVPLKHEVPGEGTLIFGQPPKEAIY
jgi:hypothetical protein